MVEIERKFRVGEVPGLEAAAATPIEQGYLAVDDAAEVRLRRAGEGRRLTAKRGHGAERAEVEIDLAAADFERLWPLTAGRRLEKTRRRLPLGDGLTVEVDVYGGELAGLRVAEVEFPDAEAERRFEPPDWFGRELTGDDDYANQTLAARGLPAAESAPDGHEGAVAAREWDAAR